VPSGGAGIRPKAEMAGLDLFKKAKGRLPGDSLPLKFAIGLLKNQNDALIYFDLVAFAILVTLRVDTPSFVAGALATTLAFFVAFSELIKLFFSIVINHSSSLGLPINDHEKEGAVI
jgi:hypothetical protein